MTGMSLKELVLNFESLSVYRNLLEDKVIKKLHELINFLDGDKLELDGFVRLYNEFFFQLTVSNSTGTFKNYIIEKLIFDENPFSRLAEGVCFEDIDEHLIQAVSKDLDSLYAISCLTSNEIKKLAVDKICSCGMERDVKNKLPDMTRKNRPPVSSPCVEEPSPCVACVGKASIMGVSEKIEQQSQSFLDSIPKDG